MNGIENFKIDNVKIDGDKIIVDLTITPVKPMEYIKMDITIEDEEHKRLRLIREKRIRKLKKL